MHRVLSVITSTVLALAIVGCSSTIKVAVDVPEPPIRERPDIVAMRTDKGVEVEWQMWEQIIKYITHLETDIELVRAMIRSLKGADNE